MKTIGIIGGMSYESSLHYYERINKQINQIEGGLTSAKLLMYNVNFEEVRKLMLDNKWEEIGLYLTNISQTLEKAGVDYIVIATNTMHKLADFIQSKIHIPLIHIADCVAEKCKENKILNVGLLGTKYTMVEDFLTNRLKQNGLQVITPKNQKVIEEIDRIIFEELCKGIIKSSSREYYKNVINQMEKESQIKGIILGCTEIEMLVGPNDLTIPIFDTTKSHIDTIVDYSLERKLIKR